MIRTDRRHIVRAYTASDLTAFAGKSTRTRSPDHSVLAAGARWSTSETIPLHGPSSLASILQRTPITSFGFSILSARVLSGTASLDGLKTGLTAPGGATIFCFHFSLAVGAALTGFGSPA